MANIQEQFKRFNKDIRADFKHDETLRNKRNIIRKRLRKNLPGVFAKYEESELIPKFRDQGSYRMGTGVKPLAASGGFDIDQGVYFETSIDGTYVTPVTLKKRVKEALNGLTVDMPIRRPCVTVFYKQNGEERAYHVDLAIYSARGSNSDGKDYLATGRETSPATDQEWKVSDPSGLRNNLFSRFSEKGERLQFRRAIRFLKRWKDERFASSGNGAPRGIGLTLNAHYGFQVTYFDEAARTPNDLGAMRTLVAHILGEFKHQWREKKQEWGRCLVATLPVEPWSDVYENMTLVQMTDFETELKELQSALDYAHNEVDPQKACERLQKVFGADFLVPPKSDTALTTPPPTSSSGISG